MSTSPLETDENQRLGALGKYKIIDTPAEQAFDQLSQLAAHICNTPLAAISLVDNNRLWFKSKVGFTEPEIPLNMAFCAYTISQRELFIIPNTLADERFKNHPLVISEPHLRFYAGAPLITADGFILGTLCVLDYQPRDLSSEQQKALLMLAQHIVTQMESRRYTQRVESMHEIDCAILAERSPEGSTKAALKLLRQPIPCQLATVVLFDFDKGEAKIIAENERNLNCFTSGILPIEKFSYFNTFEKEKIIYIKDIAVLKNPPALLKDLIEAGIHSFIRIPLVINEISIGELILANKCIAAFDSEHQEIAREVAVQLAVVIQNYQLFEQVHSERQRLQILSGKLMAAQETERRRIAQELHDEIGQSLTALKINLQTLEHLPNFPANALPIQESIGIVERTLQQVRNLSLDLRPSLLDDLGLVSALRWYVSRQAQRCGIVEEFVTTPLTRISPELETTCFRIAQEALNNIAKHSQAKKVYVELQQYGTEIHLIICDDGVGFDVQAARERATQGGSLGLLGMEERTLLVGGRIKIESAPMKGTQIHVRFPLTNSASYVERRSPLRVP